MEAPSGGPAPYTTRLGLPEDDVTFAPPPMSAYSIAVFNNNGAYSPSQERTKNESFIARDQRSPAENAALRDQLKRKLSVHFSRSPAGTREIARFAPACLQVLQHGFITRKNTQPHFFGKLGLDSGHFQRFRCKYEQRTAY
ncbi:hypothetical protein OXX69_008244 [Metschnikowia pulcherrima]